MITILSPAKKLTKDCSAHTASETQPEYLNQSKSLISILKQCDPPDLQELMGISENLSILNWERYRNWKLPFGRSNARQAFFSFQGDTYTGLDADTMDSRDLLFAQDHTRILSGLYGILKPLDLIMPYRLEMGTKLATKSGKSLYDFWGHQLSKALMLELEPHIDSKIINCASVEYFKALDNPELEASVITPVFKEIKNGKTRMVSFFAKQARGMMARYIIQNQINQADDILKFNLGGYHYNEAFSSPLAPVFIRAQA